jgi:hypothetical protein
MADTDIYTFLDTLHGILGYADNTGSVNLYMGHGGTNFGYTAGSLPLRISMHPFFVASCARAWKCGPTLFWIGQRTEY